MPADQSQAREEALYALAAVDDRHDFDSGDLPSNGEYIDALLALGWLPPEAPVAPARERLIDALRNSPAATMPQWADNLLATPNLWQSRAEVQAEALEWAAQKVFDLNVSYISDRITSQRGFAVEANMALTNRATAIREGATK